MADPYQKYPLLVMLNSYVSFILFNQIYFYISNKPATISPGLYLVPGHISEGFSGRLGRQEEMCCIMEK